MSLSRNPSFFSEYAKSGYLKRMNPEFMGVAQRYYKEKKQHLKVHQMKDKLAKEVAYMERMEKRMEQALVKKQAQLKHTKDTTNRFQSDMRRVGIRPLRGSNCNSR